MSIGLWDGTTGDQSWWSVKLDGVVLPGKTTVEVGQSGGGITENKPPGNQGAFSNDEGVDLSKVVITILLANDRDVQEFNEKVTPLFFPLDKRARRRPMTIEHPATLLDRIDRVVWVDRSIPVPSAKNGQIITLNLLEHQEPEKTKTKAQTKGAGAGSGSVDLKAQDVIDSQREAMRTKNQANSGGGPRTANRNNRGATSESARKYREQANKKIYK